VGAYESGSNRDLDLAIKLRPALENYLRQDMNAPAPYAECREALKRLLGG
jgi:flagellum-specific ATP synthase